MKCKSAMPLALFVVVGSAWVSNAAVHGAASNSPVERVVNLLKDLKEKLQADEKVEQQIYDKYACWCEKTTASKAEGITVAQKELRQLGQSILSLRGRVATLAAEIEERVRQIAANKAAQEEATSIREKANAAFMGASAEMKQAIAALQQAVSVLTSATIPGASLLQASQRAGDAVSAVIGAMPEYVAVKSGDVDTLRSFLQERGGGKYTPQSLTVQGILADMYRTFAEDLETATANEATSQMNFEKFIDTKKKALSNLQAQMQQRQEEKADTEAQLADTQQIYDDTTAQKEADSAFFDQTKEACISKHNDWTVRSGLRTDEISGLTQALTILTADTARELFGSTIKAGKETGMDESYETGRDITFIQVGSSAPAQQAYATLKKQASAIHSFRLAALAVKVREAKAGHFDEVISAINAMMQVLREEDTADIQKRDQCKEQYQQIESKVKNVAWLIEKNVAKIHKLENLIELRTKQKEETQTEIVNINEAMRVLTETRGSENEAFLKSKSDDQDAIDLLIAARGHITLYYKKNGIDMGPIQGSVKGLALAQQPNFEISADQAPDTVFSNKGQRKDETKGIVQILTSILEDLDDEIKNSMKAEENAQLEFEQQMKAARKVKADLVAKETSLDTAIAARGSEKQLEESDKGDNELDLENEHTYKKSITDDCDFIIRAFDKRATDRTAEMQGLEGAKEYLVGYSPAEAALFERKTTGSTFNDAALSKTRFLGLA